jgi:EpsI family protein
MRLFAPRQRAVLIAMLAAAGLAVALKPGPLPTGAGVDHWLDTAVPKQLRGWKLDDSNVTVVRPDLQEKLDEIYTDTLARTYVNARGERIMLSIARGSDQRDSLQVHMPEGCYEGQGFAVGLKSRGFIYTAFGGFPVARLLASKGRRIEPITYWIVVGERVVDSAWDMKKVKLIYALHGKSGQGTLMRISSISTDAQAAYVLHQEFAVALLEALPSRERVRLMGSDT